MIDRDGVAVIVPARDAREHLRRALTSLQDQTQRPAQVIVVDDGSSDETQRIAEQHGAQVLRQESGGLGVALNRGLEAAMTPFVAFLDADDWYDPQKIAQSVRMLRELDAQCLATDAWVVKDGRIVERQNGDRSVPSTLTHEHLLRGNPVVCSSVVARREAVLAAGCFDVHPDLVATTDYDLWLRMAHQEPIAYLPEPLTFHRLGGECPTDGPQLVLGVDRALDKVEVAHRGEAHFMNLLRRRRGDARLELAWELLRDGEFDEARRWLRAAGEFGRSWSYWRARALCMLKRRPKF